MTSIMTIVDSVISLIVIPVAVFIVSLLAFVLGLFIVLTFLIDTFHN